MKAGNYPNWHTEDPCDNHSRRYAEALQNLDQKRSDGSPRECRGR